MNDNTVNLAEVTGQQSSQLVDIDGLLLHRSVRPDWKALQLAAREAGFELQAVSAYRSFERQLEIWNRKARGERPVFDANGEPVDVASLNQQQRLWAILRWSALPGASRHHWGTDLDVIDRAAVADDYCVQLADSEVYGEGPFVSLHNWLDGLIEQDKAFGFYRPYVRQGQPQTQGLRPAPAGCETALGIAPERWHLSHRPTSLHYARCLSRDAMREFYRGLETLELQSAVLQHFDDIYSHFICV